MTREKFMTRIEEMIEGVNPTLPEEDKQFYFKCDEDIGTNV